MIEHDGNTYRKAVKGDIELGAEVALKEEGDHGAVAPGIIGNICEDEHYGAGTTVFYVYQNLIAGSSPLGGRAHVKEKGYDYSWCCTYYDVGDKHWECEGYDLFTKVGGGEKQE